MIVIKYLSWLHLIMHRANGLLSENIGWTNGLTGYQTIELMDWVRVRVRVRGPI